MVGAQGTFTDLGWTSGNVSLLECGPAPRQFTGMMEIFVFGGFQVSGRPSHILPDLMLE